MSTTQFLGAAGVECTTQYDALSRPVTDTTNATAGQGTDQNLETVTVYLSIHRVAG